MDRGKERQIFHGFDAIHKSGFEFVKASENLIGQAEFHRDPPLFHLVFQLIVIHTPIMLDAKHKCKGILYLVPV